MRKWGGRRSLVAFLLGVAVSAAGWSGAGFLYLRGLGLNVRLRPVGELDSRLASGSLRTRPAGTPAAGREFLRLLENAGFRAGSVRTVQEAVRLQVWVGNQVPNVAVHQGTERGVELLRYGMQGGGLACGAMADILREALVLLGVPARAVVLSQSDFRIQTHAVVEAFLEDEWRVLDPTFNVTYQGASGALGVAAIQERFGRHGPGAVQAVWHGARRYPADLLRDAPDWPRYFSSAYVYEIGRTPRTWRLLPPLRYWAGPAHYHFGDQLTALPAVQDQLYFVATVWLPVVCLATVLLACVLIHTEREPCGPTDGNEAPV
jgi:hypothetical protein